MMKKETTFSRILLGAGYLYLLVPFAIFSLAWLRWYVALPLVALCAVSLVLMMRHAPPLWTPPLNRRNLLLLGGIAILVFVWVAYSGVGRWTYQNDDHYLRNALFRMLVERSWPIAEMSPPSEWFEGPVAFVYYFGFWLPPALVGKLFGMAAGNFAQVLWAWGGIMLFYWLVLAQDFKKIKLWPLVVFMLFSGMDWVGDSIMSGRLINVVTATPHLDNWPDYFQFSSFTTQLYWVYNQAVPGWVATMLLYVQKDNRCLALIASATLISGTLPAVGLVPIGIYIAFRNWRAANPATKFSPLSFLQGIATVENGTGVLVAVISMLFLSSNNNSQNIGSLFHVWDIIWPLWLLFLACEAVVLLLLVAKYQWKSAQFWLVAALLVAMPWLRINDKADFGMRATIPALILLYLMVLDALVRSFKEKGWGKLLFAGLCAVLVIGSATAATEIIRSVALTRYMQKTGPVVTEEWAPMEVVWRDNFYGYTTDRFFFDHLMRTPPAD